MVVALYPMDVDRGRLLQRRMHTWHLSATGRYHCCSNLSPTERYLGQLCWVAALYMHHVAYLGRTRLILTLRCYTPALSP